MGSQSVKRDWVTHTYAHTYSYNIWIYKMDKFQILLNGEKYIYAFIEKPIRAKSRFLLR